MDSQHINRLAAGTGVPFVVLQHTGWGDAHFDLLVDPGDPALLLTWRIAQWPPTASTPATRQPDHRRVYLTYEGPISDNRGSVRRFASGIATVVAADAHFVMLQFADATLRLPSR